MSELTRRVESLERDVNEATKKINLANNQTKLKVLQDQTRADNFWRSSDDAQAVMKQIAQLEAINKPWSQLTSDAKELNELAQLNDLSLAKDIEKRLDSLEEQYNKLKGGLKLNQPYDDHAVLVSIHAGAGGTDAQDWTQILFRMYSRWTEKVKGKLQIIEESPGEEAGLKSVTFSLEAPFAYGKLKGEHGVHRLVRLSPFNADNLRQTSFAKVEIMPRIDRPAEIEIDEKDLKIDVFRAGGHGGQSVNTTDSAVRITHQPTDITVSIQNERSQLQNKETAMTILRSKLAQLRLEQHQDELTKLKGPSQSAEWGNQIRSYVLHPYKQVKDLRTKYETSNAQDVLDGNLDPLIDAYLEHQIST